MNKRLICAALILLGVAPALAQGHDLGAGYPALAKNLKLEEAGYPVSVILHGQKAMLPLGGLLSDQQIADVVNYVRANFGNHYRGTVTAADVKAAR